MHIAELYTSFAYLVVFGLLHFVKGYENEGRVASCPREIIMHVLIHCKLLERNLKFFLVTDINTVSNYCSGEEYLLSISRLHIDEMIAHALDEHPNECCGVLVGVGSVVSHLYRITNKAASSYRYLMDPQEFLEVDREYEKKGHGMLAF